MNNKTLTIPIIVLVLIAAGLGYAIYKQRSPGSDLLKARQLPKTISPGSSGTLLEEELRSMSLEEKERVVLNPPKEDSPPEDQERHFQIARSIAVAVPYLDITNCERGEPLVFLAKEGEKFTIKNEDSVDHTLSLGPKQTFLVVAHSTKTILPKFEKGPGIYGYGCDSSMKEVGMILVTL